MLARRKQRLEPDAVWRSLNLEQPALRLDRPDVTASLHGSPPRDLVVVSPSIAAATEVVADGPTELFVASRRIVALPLAEPDGFEVVISSNASETPISIAARGWRLVIAERDRPLRIEVYEPGQAEPSVLEFHAKRRPVLRDAVDRLRRRSNTIVVTR